jgi:hypothetical protein
MNETLFNDFAIFFEGRRNLPMVNGQLFVVENKSERILMANQRPLLAFGVLVHPDLNQCRARRGEMSTRAHILAAQNPKSLFAVTPHATIHRHCFFLEDAGYFEYHP